MKNFGKIVRVCDGVRAGPKKNAPFDTWWWITPLAVRRMIGVLGFEDSSVEVHFDAPRMVRLGIF